MANLVLPFSNFLSTFPRPFPVVNTDEQPNPGIFQHIGNVCPERSRTGAASRRRPTPDSHSALRNHSPRRYGSPPRTLPCRSPHSLHSSFLIFTSYFRLPPPHTSFASVRPEPHPVSLLLTPPPELCEMRRLPSQRLCRLLVDATHSVE